MGVEFVVSTAIASRIAKLSRLSLRSFKGIWCLRERRREEMERLGVRIRA